MMTCETQAAAIGAVVLPGTPRAARIIRHFVTDLLGPDLPSLDDLTLCLTELVANAVIHTISGLGGFVTVELSEPRRRFGSMSPMTVARIPCPSYRISRTAKVAADS